MNILISIVLAIIFIVVLMYFESHSRDTLLEIKINDNKKIGLFLIPIDIFLFALLIKLGTILLSLNNIIVLIIGCMLCIFIGFCTVLLTYRSDNPDPYISVYGVITMIVFSIFLLFIIFFNMSLLVASCLATAIIFFMFLLFRYIYGLCFLM